MIVRVLNEEDVEAYRTIRLRALEKSPEAFLASYDVEVRRPLEVVAERIQPTDDKFFLGAFDDDGRLTGIVSLMRETNPKVRHKANVYQMYVDDVYRGRGLGRALMQELIRRAREMDDLERIHLTVVSSNASATRLYKSVGFQVYGTEQNAMKVDGHYLAEDLMVLVL